MKKETFRYISCGGANTIFGWTLFYIIDEIILKKADISFVGFTFSSHFTAATAAFVACTSVGFLLNKFVVFTKSTAKGRKQAFRYLISSFLALSTSLLILKFLVEECYLNHTFSQVVATSASTVMSYLLQSKFTFKPEK